MTDTHIIDRLKVAGSFGVIELSELIVVIITNEIIVSSLVGCKIAQQDTCTMTNRMSDSPWNRTRLRSAFIVLESDGGEFGFPHNMHSILVLDSTSLIICFINI